ncbi:MAG: IS3 family transposase [Candidatus Omnitrophica bacterium]|nr:IS3 family transposase [Candidatus Omnitrophota bacterium]
MEHFGIEALIPLIDSDDSDFSVRQQCRLLGINRSTLYYEEVALSERDILLMKNLDEQHTKMPFYGVIKMTKAMRDRGFAVGKDHIRTLLRKMGIVAIFAKPYTSKAHPENKIFPYLLKDLEVTRPNQVWSADITYIRLEYGFVYLVAIIDWYSRYIISWRLSNTLTVDFCAEALDEALMLATPEFFNTDQGSQFTSQEFIGRLVDKKINISMDGRGRVFDNIFIERFWRSMKYENVYPNNYRNIAEAKEGLKKYFTLYNVERYHESLDYKTPWEVYSGIQINKEVIIPKIVPCSDLGAAIKTPCSVNAEEFFSDILLESRKIGENEL